jgi:hypothetical protein
MVINQQGDFLTPSFKRPSFSSQSPADSGGEPMDGVHSAVPHKGSEYLFDVFIISYA